MSPAPTLRRRRSPLTTGRRAFAFVLAVALVAVQLLGLAHRVVHADRAQLGATTTSAVAVGAEPAPAAVRASHAHRGAGSWLLAVFAGHDPGGDCDAFDQMSHADVVFAVVPAASSLPAATPACPAHAAWQVAAQAQGFLARGPPAFA